MELWEKILSVTDNPYSLTGLIVLALMVVLRVALGKVSTLHGTHGYGVARYAITVIGIVALITAIASIGIKYFDLYLASVHKPSPAPTPAALGRSSEIDRPIAGPLTSCQRKETGRFVVNECCSILDKRNDLEWFVGEDRNVTWSEAYKWSASLSECGGGWRLPTEQEVLGIYEPGKEAGIGYFVSGRKYPDGRYFRAQLDPVFFEIGHGAWVWLRDQPVGNEGYSFNLNQGEVVRYNQNTSSYATRAFAVRDAFQ